MHVPRLLENIPPILIPGETLGNITPILPDIFPEILILPNVEEIIPVMGLPGILPFRSAREN
jgi:hypothetical protein